MISCSKFVGDNLRCMILLRIVRDSYSDLN
jgi:hypothetical protein